MPGTFWKCVPFALISKWMNVTWDNYIKSLRRHHTSRMSHPLCALSGILQRKMAKIKTFVSTKKNITALISFVCVVSYAWAKTANSLENCLCTTLTLGISHLCVMLASKIIIYRLEMLPVNLYIMEIHLYHSFINFCTDYCQSFLILTNYQS